MFNTFPLLFKQELSFCCGPWVWLLYQGMCIYVCVYLCVDHFSQRIKRLLFLGFSLQRAESFSGHCKLALFLDMMGEGRKWERALMSHQKWVSLLHWSSRIFFFSQELVFYLTHLEKVILKWYSDNWKVETTSYKWAIYPFLADKVGLKYIYHLFITEKNVEYQKENKHLARFWFYHFI